MKKGNRESAKYRKTLLFFETEIKQGKMILKNIKYNYEINKYYQINKFSGVFDTLLSFSNKMLYNNI